MPTPTYTPLANVTLGSSAASVTFSSISGSYRDLVFVFNGSKTTSGAISVGLQFNSDTGSNYSNVFMYGDGSSVQTGASTSTMIFTGRVAGVNNIGDGVTSIMDYSATDKHKSVISRGNAVTDNITIAYAGRWANTAAITSIKAIIENGSGSFAVGSTFALYGIAS